MNEHERFAAAAYSAPNGATVDLDLVELYRDLIQSGRCGRRPCPLRLERTHSLGGEK
jgi:hypothetical protein